MEEDCWILRSRLSLMLECNAFNKWHDKIAKVFIKIIICELLPRQKKKKNSSGISVKEQHWSYIMQSAFTAKRKCF